MMKITIEKPLYLLCIYLIVLTGCSQIEQEATETTESDNASWNIASEKFIDINERSLKALTSLNIDEWLGYLSEDVEYYFPDGDAGTRTKLVGKEAVENWWKNWKQTSGIQSMTVKNPVYLPVEAKESLNYTGLSGVYVLSYYSNELVFDSGSTSIRMNFATHFNADTLIDRYYTYYDRTPIIDVMKMNILAPGDDEMSADQ